MHVYETGLLRQNINIKKTIFLAQGGQGECSTCIKSSQKPIGEIMGPNKTFTMKEDVCFSHVSIDLSGPYNIKLTSTTPEMTWILGVTCNFSRFLKSQVLLNLEANSVLT